MKQLILTDDVNACWFSLRIHKSLQFPLQVAKCHIKLELKNDEYTELKGEIAGPPDTPYDGGVFQLDIIIPETYPFNPPKVTSTHDSFHIYYSP